MHRLALLGCVVLGLGCFLVGCEEDDEEPIYLGPVAAAGFAPAPPYTPGTGGAGAAGAAGASGAAGTAGAAGTSGLTLTACDASVAGTFRGVAPTSTGFWLGTAKGVAFSTSACAGGAAGDVPLAGVVRLATRGTRLVVAREKDVVDLDPKTGAQQSCPGVALRSVSTVGAVVLGTTAGGKLLSFDGGCGTEVLTSSKITVALAAGPAVASGTAWVAGLDAAGALLVRKVVLGTGGDAAVQPVSATELCSADAVAETGAGVYVVDGACRKLHLFPTDGGERRSVEIAAGTSAPVLLPSTQGGAVVVLDGGTSWRLAAATP